MNDNRVTVAVLFAMSLGVSNILASKIVTVTVPGFGAAVAPAGFVAIAAAFLFSDLLSELYGEEYAKRVVNSTIVGLLLVLGLSYTAVWMEPAPFFTGNEAFVSTITSSGYVTASSILTLLVSQNLDIKIFHFLKRLTDGKYKIIRNVGSTSISQLLDTVLFITLAFFVFPSLFGGSVTPLAAVGGLIVSQYVLKLVVALLDTPLFYAATFK